MCILKLMKRPAFMDRLGWEQHFLIASLVILLAGMAGIGFWVNSQIQSGVVHQTAAYTALYVSSMVEPRLQALSAGDVLAPEDVAALSSLFKDKDIGQHIVAVKVWNKDGKVIYATEPRTIGLVFPIERNLRRALRGWVASEISTLDKSENVFDADRGKRRLETYSPVRRTGTAEIIAAVEFYQTVDSLDKNIAAAQRNSWLIMGIATLVMYGLLAGFVRRASDTLRRQRDELSSQVIQLQNLLAQNEELHERVRRAAQQTTTINERFLRRIGAELHDGPAQDLGYALLRLEHLVPSFENGTASQPDEGSDFYQVQASLRHGLQEIRAISAGVGLPELENVTLGETIARAVRAHERRTGTQVSLVVDDIPEISPASVKMTVYRIIQEALSNAFRHANGAGQRVEVTYSPGLLELVVSDQGQGFDGVAQADWDEHLGLVGMRERVESLGGTFSIVSEKGEGTEVRAKVPLEGLGESV